MTPQLQGRKVLHGSLGWIQFIHQLILLFTPKVLQSPLILTTAIAAQKVIQEISMFKVFNGEK